MISRMNFKHPTACHFPISARNGGCCHYSSIFISMVLAKYGCHSVVLQQCSGRRVLPKAMVEQIERGIVVLDAEISTKAGTELFTQNPKN